MLSTRARAVSGMSNTLQVHENRAESACCEYAGKLRRGGRFEGGKPILQAGVEFLSDVVWGDIETHWQSQQAFL
eukprot:9406150-Pyramimonas_sp.AAC.1